MQKLMCPKCKVKADMKTTGQEDDVEYFQCQSCGKTFGEVTIKKKIVKPEKKKDKEK